MLEVDPIKAEYFYKSEAEKIKLNWFCYEFAFGMYDKIRKAAELEKYRETHSQQNIVDFCVFFSKRMKESIFQRLGGLTPAVMFYEEYVEEFYPKITRKRILQLMKPAMEAFEELIEICVNCPNRCISEMHVYCHMFDMLDKDGFLG
jgi:hypothetical protein